MLLDIFNGLLIYINRFLFSRNITKIFSRICHEIFAIPLTSSYFLEVQQKSFMFEIINKYCYLTKFILKTLVSLKKSRKVFELEFFSSKSFFSYMKIPTLIFLVHHFQNDHYYSAVLLHHHHHHHHHHRHRFLHNQ